MVKAKLSLLVVFIIVAVGCTPPQSVDNGLDKREISNTFSAKEQQILPKEMVIFIGRGGCCYGHFISIDKAGDLQYSVAAYTLTTFDETHSENHQPKTFDPALISVDKKYAPQSRKIPADKVERLARLIQDEKTIYLNDTSVSDDDFIYYIYLDKSRIALGYESHLKSFPENLQELISLIIGEVELHELPGMA
ncbi:MAG: hypothetical protein IPM21_04775 [Acidobacteria bacterium]|nr:hypothetical protein [Acidobacteriota bacterium]